MSGVVTGLVALLGCGGPTQGCRLVGCESVVSGTYSLTAQPADLVGATITVCRDAACFNQVIQQVTYTTGSSQVMCPYDATNPILCNVTAASGGSSINIRFIVDPNTAHDGEAFTVSVVATSGGSALVSAQKTVQYTTSQPNGPDCEPTCKQASLI
jgi:hypothetical protein